MGIYIKSMGAANFDGRRIVHLGCDAAADAAAITGAGAVTLYDGTKGPQMAPGSVKTVLGGAAYELNTAGSWVPVSGTEAG